jgi:hypothetical protein
MAVLKQLDRPVKILFVVGNGLVWLSFCVAMVLGWQKMSISVRWSDVTLAAAFLLLGRSLLKDDDLSSRLMYATGAFLATMIVVCRSLSGFSW